jgi:hypothetical protein
MAMNCQCGAGNGPAHWYAISIRADGRRGRVRLESLRQFTARGTPSPKRVGWLIMLPLTPRNSEPVNN